MNGTFQAAVAGSGSGRDRDTDRITRVLPRIVWRVTTVQEMGLLVPCFQRRSMR